MIEKIKNLIEQKDYKSIKLELINLDEADIAEILEELDINNIIKIYRILPKDIAATVFSKLPIDLEQELMTSLTDKEGIDIISNMYADDATDLLDEMPAGIVKKLLSKVDSETRRDINHLLKYPDNSAGSIMTVEYIDLKEDIAVKNAIEKIREEGTDSELIDTCFVVDSGRKLTGLVNIKHLLLSKDNVLIKNIMDEHSVFTTTLTDQEEVAELFKKYDLTSMPVVDSENRLVGIITIDDVVDIMEQETTEDMEKMAAISPSDKPYLKTGVFETWQKRIPWLLLLMISAAFTGKIIQSYENALASYVILTSFIPMLMDTGGNAGGQASVTIIRGLSLNEIEFKDTLKILWKEIRVAVLCGITLAICNFAKLLFIDKTSILVAMVVCFTLIVTILVAKVIGCLLPIAAKKIGFDPTVMASPFITTIVDACSLVVYFKIATILLGI